MRRVPPQSPARKELVRMMGLVIAVHTIAIVIYRLGDIQHRPERVGRAFGAVWTTVTLVVVAIGLYRVRVARRSRRS